MNINMNIPAQIQQKEYQYKLCNIFKGVYKNT